LDRFDAFDRLRAVEGKAANEDGEAAKQRLLRRGEEVVAPSNRPLHRLQARRVAAGAASEKRQAPVEPGQQLLRRENISQGGCQFDREWQPVEPTADLRNRRRAFVRQGEFGPLRPRALDKQAHCFVLAQVNSVGSAVCWQRQRLDREDIFAVDAQRFPARREHFEVGTGREEIVDERRRREHVLDVVEDEKKLAIPQCHEQSIGKRLVSSLTDANRLGDGGNDEVRFAHWGEIDEAGAIVELGDEIRGNLSGETGLTDPTGTSQGEQRNVGLEQELTDGGKFALPADQHRARQW
jgi:hypothetical protein